MRCQQTISSGPIAATASLQIATEKTGDWFLNHSNHLRDLLRSRIREQIPKSARGLLLRKSSLCSVRMCGPLYAWVHQGSQHAAIQRVFWRFEGRRGARLPPWHRRLVRGPPRRGAPRLAFLKPPLDGPITSWRGLALTEADSQLPNPHVPNVRETNQRWYFRRSTSSLKGDRRFTSPPIA